MSLPISLITGDYDRTRPLLDGTVKPDAIDLTCTASSPIQTFERFIGGDEFDAGEMSLSNLIMLTSRGDAAFVGIPVFLSRVFRHGYIFVNANAGIEAPSDLVGKRVGVFEYTMTAAVWIRGLLQHEYGIEASQLNWYTGRVNQPGRRDPWISVSLPSGVELQEIADSDCLGDMLEEGRIDALFGASVPDVVKRRSPSVRRLFPNHSALERDYYRRTGLVHLMHTVAIRAQVYQRDPWLAELLYRAFARAKDAAMSRLEATGAPHVALTWLQAHLETEREIFGHDTWPYGIPANRTSLEALTGYVHEQGLTSWRVPVDSLFASETLEL